MEVSWLFSALIDRQPINPTHLNQPVLLWVTSGSGDIRFGVLPLLVGYLFETGYYKEPEASPSRDLPRIWL
jgi:hypothetical protein